MSKLILPSWDLTLKVVEERASQNSDAEGVSPKDITFLHDENSVPILSFPHPPLSFTGNGLTQFLQKLGIPPIFFRRCSTSLSEKIVEEFKTRLKSQLLIRCVAPTPTTSQIRAILSSRYHRFDDKDLFPLLREALESAAYDPKPLSFEPDELITTFELSFEGLKASTETGQISAGLQARNSEVGHAATAIEPCISLPNDITLLSGRTQPSNPALRLTHISNSELTKEAITETIPEILKYCQLMILQAVAADKEPEKHPEAALSSISGKTSLLATSAQAMILEWYQQQAEASRLAFVNQVLGACKDLPLVQKYQLQISCGRYLGLGAADKWSHLLSEKMAEQE